MEKAYRVTALNYTVYSGTTIIEIPVHEVGSVSVFYAADHNVANELRVTASALWFKTFREATDWVGAEIATNARRLDVQRRELAALYSYVEELIWRVNGSLEATAPPVD